MVVSVLRAMWRRRRRAWQTLPRVTALLAGIAIQPGQPGSVASLPTLQLPGVQGSLLNSELRALGTLPAQAQPLAPSGSFAPPAALPGLQLRGIEGILWDSELRAFGNLPWETQPLWAPFDIFAAPARSPNLPDFTTTARDAGLPNPSGSLVWGQGATGPPAMGASSSALAGQLDGTVSTATDQFGVVGGPAWTVRRVAPGSLQIVCNAQMPLQLQAGGEFWSAQAISAAPGQFPAAEFIASSYVNPDNLGDPTLDPRGDRSNLSLPGPEGAWCQAPPVRFDQSSPLASRTFWTPFALVLAGVGVLWMSRGVRLPRV